MKRPSVFYVTENGTTRYGMTRSYGGLAGITLRLLTHATDGYGISIPYFERLTLLWMTPCIRIRNRRMKMRFQKKKWMNADVTTVSAPVCRFVRQDGINSRQPCFEPFRANFRGLGTGGFQAEPQGRKV